MSAPPAAGIRPQLTIPSGRGNTHGHHQAQRQNNPSVTSLSHGMFLSSHKAYKPPQPEKFGIRLINLPPGHKTARADFKRIVAWVRRCLLLSSSCCQSTKRAHGLSSFQAQQQLRNSPSWLRWDMDHSNDLQHTHHTSSKELLQWSFMAAQEKQSFNYTQCDFVHDFQCSRREKGHCTPEIPWQICISRAVIWDGFRSSKTLCSTQ